jgi:hypothetical protein
MHRRATRTAWQADRPGRNPDDDPEKPGSKTGVSTCAIAPEVNNAAWFDDDHLVPDDHGSCKGPHQTAAGLSYASGTASRADLTAGQRAQGKVPG